MERIEMQCGTFQTKSNTSRHKRTCKACPLIDLLQRENKKLKSFVNTTTTLNTLLAENQALHVELRQKNDEIQRLLREPKITQTNITNIYPYGKEPDLSEHSVKQLLFPPENSVPEYIKLKYFTQAGGNLKLTNIRSRTMQIVEEDVDGNLKWVHKDKNDVLNELAESNLEELKEKYGANKLVSWKKWYDDLGDDCYDKFQWKTLTNKIELVLLNNRESN